MTCIYAIYKRPTSEQRFTQTKRKGMEKIFQANGHEKKIWGSNIYVRLNRLNFETKDIKREKE